MTFLGIAIGQDYHARIDKINIQRDALKQEMADHAVALTAQLANITSAQARLAGK